MMKLLSRISVLIALLAGSQILVCALLAKTEHATRDPRERIFGRRSPGDYKYALVGASVFTSCYVDNESQTLWEQLGRKSGTPVFPGALSAAQPDDITRILIYLGKVMKPGSVVFLDATLGKKWGKTALKANYKNRLAVIMGNYDQSWSKTPLAGAYLDFFVAIWPYRIIREDLEGLFNYVRNLGPLGRHVFIRNDRYNRIWNRDGDFASDRFRGFKQAEAAGIAGAHDFSKLDTIGDITAGSGLKLVVVLTPLNKELIKAYAPQESRKIIADFMAYRGAIRAYLEKRNMQYLDLVDAVPSEGFADMVHTNALGDELMAKEIAGYLGGRGRSPEPRPVPLKI